MKRLLLLLLGLTMGAFYAQSQEVISAGGDYFEKSVGTISWTLGELNTTTLQEGGTMLTQGQQQSRLEITTLYNYIDSDDRIIVSPNPTNDFVILRMATGDMAGMRYSLYDQRGSLLKQANLEGNRMKIKVDQLPPAVYYIRVIKGKKLIHVFKILKVH